MCVHTVWHPSPAAFVSLPPSTSLFPPTAGLCSLDVFPPIDALLLSTPKYPPLQTLVVPPLPLLQIQTA